ncbi:MAG: hypothetical protein LWX56_12325 [Ignavibacteria bacterium]|nr:hypothetical protein [Ignavibacteria bacterium]
MERKFFSPRILLAFFIILPFVAALQGCDDGDETKEKPVLNHKNAVEYYVTTTKADGKVIVTTKKDIYSNFQLLKTITTVDTLPSLGTETYEDEDDNGNKKNVTEPIAYDIYFHSEVK